ncbi:MAG: low molecular weight phosphotyrosine protein phosphatase [Aureispira sp.]|nr:low molecular weight phosphotyrosine protein phosphatase [Aureispira sp.]
MKILMICLGNICRSPLAEGILQHKANELGLDWTVDSAGTSAYHAGELPDQRSIQVARQHDLDITYQHSRQIVTSDLSNFDIIYVMDSSNYQNVLKLCKTAAQKEKVRLIMNEVEPVRNINVPDPYWGDNGFENVYQMLDKACDQVIKRYQ